MTGYDIAREYAKGNICGWAEVRQPGIAKEQFHLLNAKGAFIPFKISGQTRETKGTKTFLYQVVRKALGRDIENIPQEIGDPFVAGTMVAMADGSEKPIEKLQIGDRVVNHKNEPVTVTNVIKKQFTGKLVTVKLKGWHRTLTATETHHGMLLPHSKNCHYQYEGPQRVKFGEMSVGQHMLIPWGYEANEDVELDLTKHIDCSHFDDKYIYQKDKKVPRYIKVDERFAYLVGLYLAEGGVGSGGSITFSLNVNETNLMDEISQLVSEIFELPTSIYKTGNENCRRVSVNSHIVKEIFSNLIPGNLYSKRVPTFFFRTRREVRKALIRGWLEGDGCKKFNINNVVGYTSSSNLGDDMARICMSCELSVCSLRRQRKVRATVPSTEIALHGADPYKVYTKNGPTRAKVKPIRCYRTPYGIARKITKIETEDVVDHTVYCITTEGHFTAIFNGIASYQCVSWGARNAVEYLQCCEILLKGDRERYRPVFAPYYYGTGRVYVGGGRLGSSDGSLGSWMAEAVQKYGTLWSDEEGVPAYSGRVAKSFGDSNPRNDLDLFKEKATPYVIQGVALIRTWDEYVAAIANGYTVTIASNVGYDMEPGPDGFHRQRGNWAHQMAGVGADDNDRDPYALIRNSWGDVHGHLKDFETGEDLPEGYLRVRRKDFEKHLRANETFVFSNGKFFPERDIAKELFMLI